MDDIRVIESVNGNYFRIIKDGDTYYLRSNYTEIPNEFGFYDMDAVADIFTGLCERIPESIPVECAEGHPNATMRVIYASGKEQTYSQGKGKDAKNLCFFTARAAQYTDFLEEPSLFFQFSEWLTIENIRAACSSKSVNYNEILEAVKNLIEDDYTFIKERTDNGKMIMDKVCYGVHTDSFVTILEDGTIGNTGHLKFLAIFKKNGVRIKT